ncbi:pseudouridine synthase [Parachlamydia sp. AcF125]|uniref:pseudouridine synthase n=1 Tax=Parachlamydia sp. AcF125 TaxID=2795736 RepID=UPI001BD831E6|nr:pseudouridine synthase [Parachlamydia sp. AcF125]MBS4168250.1 Ribosomal large subunit pseudouridine synthase B [Parachlamydia sp. AcF125]
MDKTKQRLSKVMAAAGVASRRACEALIFEGCVTVNGQITLIPQTLVDENDVIICKGHTIGKKQNKVYYILNKPVGYICSNRRHKDAKIVLDLFKDVKERLFTVGRLDKDTGGLLIVTNDGHFANRVIHPSANIPKEYLVRTNVEVEAEHLSALSSGTLVEQTFVRPIRVTKVRRGTLKITIAEGKKREIRLLMESAKLPVLELTRIRIGELRLGSLHPGEWREMTAREQALLFE